MTSKRDLKRRVRDRQARTGESYVTARRHVLAQQPGPAATAEAAPAAPAPAAAPPAVPVVELIDLSAEAARLGFRCRTAIFPALAERVDCTRLLERIRDALLATAGDPGTALFRAVVLQGERPPPTPLHASIEHLEEGRRFIARARAGLGGPSASGRMLAIHVEGARGPETAICLIWHLAIGGMAWVPGQPGQPGFVEREPSLILTSTESVFSVDSEIARMVGVDVVSLPWLMP